MASLKKRGNTRYVQLDRHGKHTRLSLRTDSLQIATAKLREVVAREAQGFDNPLPTRTPLPELPTGYVAHVRTHKAAKSAQTDVYYLREAFGPCCEALTITSRRVTENSRKRKKQPGTDGRARAVRIQASHAETVTS